MKKILVSALVLGVVFAGGILTGRQTVVAENKVAVSDVTKEGNKTITEFSDGSWSVVNEKEGVYVFQPVDMGDWDYECKDNKELSKVIDTYLAMKNEGTF